LTETTRVYSGHDCNNLVGIIYIIKSTNLFSCIHSALIKNHGGYHADNMIICSELCSNIFQKQFFPHPRWKEERKGSPEYVANSFLDDHA
jgi:hypothetical protein